MKNLHLYLKKCGILVFILVQFTGYVYAHNQTTADVDHLNNEAKKHYNSSFPKSKHLATQGLLLASQIGYTRGYIISTCAISLVDANTNNCKKALDSLYALLPAVAGLKDNFVHKLLYETIGTCWYVHGNYDSAKSYYGKSLALYSPPHVPVAYAQQCLLMARVYLKTGNQPKATGYYNNALAILNKHKVGTALANDVMGEIYYAQRLYEKALASHNQSITAFTKARNKRGMASALLHKGNAHYMLMQDDSALHCYTLALQNFAALGDSNGIATSYSNLSRVFLEQGNFEKALNYARQALGAIKPGEYVTIEAGTCQQIGDIYGEMGQHEKAVTYVLKALSAARASGNMVIIKDCYKSLSELYQAMGKQDKAMESLLAAYRLKDSIQPVAFTRQLAEMEAKYESEKKQAEITLLKQQQQIDALAMQKQRFISLGLLLLLMAGVVAAYYYIARKKLLEQLLKKEVIRETEESERQRIAKDIHDELGSGLSKIKFLSELAAAQAKEEKQLKASLLSISDTSRGLVENMRDLVWAMNPENNTLANLVAHIREYSHEYLEEFPAELVFDIPDDVPQQKVSKQVSRHVYMIVKELLQNIVKHSAATTVHIKIRWQPKFILEVKDNGKGYTARPEPTGNGLKNINARCAALGGTVRMDPAPGKGLYTRLEFDLNQHH